METKHIDKQFGWKRNFEYIKANLIIMWKNLIEYKANLYGSIAEQLLFFSVQFMFLFVFYTSFGDVIGWDLMDYVLFIILVDLIACFTGLFLWKNPLGSVITTGGLNQYLVRPSNIFIKYYFSSINSSAMFYVISDILLLSISIFYIGYDLFAILYSSMLLLLYFILL